MSARSCEKITTIEVADFRFRENYMIGVLDRYEQMQTSPGCAFHAVVHTRHRPNTPVGPHRH
jgi:hypothetical protein